MYDGMQNQLDNADNSVVYRITENTSNKNKSMIYSVNFRRYWAHLTANCAAGMLISMNRSIILRGESAAI